MTFICKTMWFYLNCSGLWVVWSLSSSIVLQQCPCCVTEVLFVCVYVCVYRLEVSRVSGRSCSGTERGQNIWMLFPTQDTGPPTYKLTGINWWVCVCVWVELIDGNCLNVPVVVCVYCHVCPCQTTAYFQPSHDGFACFRGPRGDHPATWITWRITQRSRSGSRWSFV